MMAIRTQSLTLDCIIGVTTSSTSIHPLVTRDYIKLLLEVCNQRFVENKRKMGKISSALGTVLFPPPQEPSTWEDPEVRRRRKREEGLARAEEVRRKKEEARRLKEMEENVDEERG